MPSTIFFLVATVLLSLNFIRPFGLAISDWLYALAVLFAVSETLSIDRRNLTCWTKNKLFLPAAIILLGGLLTTFRSAFPSVALIEVFQQFYVLSVFPSLIWILVRRGYTSTVIFAFILSGTFAAAVAFYDFAFGAQLGNVLSNILGKSFGGRYAGPLGHPNKLGYFLALTAPLTLLTWHETQSKGSRIFHSTSFLLQIIGIYLSGSVTAFVGFSAGLILILWRVRNLPRKLLASTGVLIFLLVLVALAKGVDPLDSTQAILCGIQKNLDRVISTTYYSRLEVYRIALDEIQENPIIGVGYDQLSTSGISEEDRLVPGTIHNVFLQILYIGGLLSFIALLGVYIYAAMKSIRIAFLKRASTTLSFGLAILMFVVMIMDQFQDAIYQREKWLVIGLLLAEAWESGSKKELIP